MKPHYLLSLFLLFTISHNSYPQNSKKKIKLPNTNYTLQEVLQVIGRQSGHIFSYNFKKINPKYPITVSKHCYESVEEGLDNILPEGMKYTINQKFIIIQVSSKTKDFVHIVQEKKVPYVVSNNKPSESTTTESTVNTGSMLESDSSSRVSAIVTPQETNIPIKETSGNHKLNKDTINNNNNNNIKKNKASRIESSDKQETPNKNQKVIFGQNRKLLELELSGYHSLACMAIHVGYTKIYGIVSSATNLKETTWVGAGIGSQLFYLNNFSLTAEISDQLLVGGIYFNSGVNANVLQFKPLISYKLFNIVNFFIGPEVYCLQKNQLNTYTNERIALATQIGVGGVIGIKYNF